MIPGGYDNSGEIFHYNVKALNEAAFIYKEVKFLYAA